MKGKSAVLSLLHIVALLADHVLPPSVEINTMNLSSDWPLGFSIGSLLP